MPEPDLIELFVRPLDRGFDSEALHCDAGWRMAEFVMHRRSFVVTSWIHHWFVAPVLLLIVLGLQGSETRAGIVLPDLPGLGYERIELRRSGVDRLFLLGKLNGHRLSVLVDTGWSFTTVSVKAARKLKTPGQPGFKVQDPLSGTNENSPAILMDRLKLGRVGFTNQPAAVQNMVFNGQSAPFDLVLGCDFLVRNFAVFDCCNRRLYVRRAAPTAEEQRSLEDSLRRRGFHQVQLELKRPLAITCRARVQGEPVEMLVDTGAAWSCLDFRQRERLGLKVTPSAARITGVGATGTRAIAVTGVKSFQLGDVETKNATLAMLDLADWGLAARDRTLSEVQGILGGEILLAMGAVIDCHGLKLWVKRSGARQR